MIESAQQKAAWLVCERAYKFSMMGGVRDQMDIVALRGPWHLDELTEVNVRALAHLVHRGSSDTKGTAIWLEIDEDKASELLERLCEFEFAQEFDYAMYRATPLGENIIIQVAEQLIGTDVALMTPYLEHAKELLRKLREIDRPS